MKFEIIICQNIVVFAMMIKMIPTRLIATRLIATRLIANYTKVMNSHMSYYFSYWELIPIKIIANYDKVMIFYLHRRWLLLEHFFNCFSHLFWYYNLVMFCQEIHCNSFPTNWNNFQRFNWIEIWNNCMSKSLKSLLKLVNP